MAERDRYDWDRTRDYGDRDREYGRGTERERAYQDRGTISRGADEVRSWFGDDEARRRREMDERMERAYGPREREFGPNTERSWREHGWSREGQHPDSPWESRREPTAYGDQRDFVGRSDEWAGERVSPRGRDWYDPGYERGAQSRRTGGSRNYGENVSRPSGNWQYTGGYGRYGAYGTSDYNREFGSTGEGRWSGQHYGSAPYSGGTFGPGTWSSGPYAGRGPRNYQRSDDRIREDVNERLTADARIDASDIEVRVQNGEVTLSGNVDQRYTRRMAEEVIEDLPGVRDVHNELRVSQNWSTQEQPRTEMSPTAAKETKR